MRSRLSARRRSRPSITYTEFPGSENDLSLQGMALILGYGIVMLGVCMLVCVVPTRRALNIEPTIAFERNRTANRKQIVGFLVLHSSDLDPGSFGDRVALAANI